MVAASSSLEYQEGMLRRCCRLFIYNLYLNMIRKSPVN